MANYLIIVSKFNDLITRSLLNGAQDELVNSGVSGDQIEVVWAPGAFEIPCIAANAVKTRKYSAIICLGAIIKGETPHFDFISSSVAQSLSTLSMNSLTPVIFGVLTTNTVDEALNRSGIKGGNKGIEAARAALQTVEALRKLEGKDRL
jgi:6,7-dimethyl-8-ribityllumazine synthase